MLMRIQENAYYVYEINYNISKLFLCVKKIS